MRNSTQKKYQSKTTDGLEMVDQPDSEESIAEVVEFVARSEIIAQQAEEACCLEGNLNDPDFDVFEEKYGLGCFA